MTRKQLLEQADSFKQELLELLTVNEGASISQNSNKEDFFRVFERAYCGGFCSIRKRIDNDKVRAIPCKNQRPQINSDTLRDYFIAQHWISVDAPQEDQRSQDVERLRTWWEEWTYAWNNLPTKQHCRHVLSNAFSVAKST